MHTVSADTTIHNKLQEVLLEIRLLVTISMARFQSPAFAIKRFSRLRHFQWS
jgi:hypothetical protein